jgi:hypothetical protein
MAERETEDLEKKDVVFDCFAFFCMFLCTSLYGAMTSSISHLPVILHKTLSIVLRKRS